MSSLYLNINIYAVNTKFGKCQCLSKKSYKNLLWIVWDIWCFIGLYIHVLSTSQIGYNAHSCHILSSNAKGENCSRHCIHDNFFMINCTTILQTKDNKWFWASLKRFGPSAPLVHPSRSTWLHVQRSSECGWHQKNIFEQYYY